MKLIIGLGNPGKEYEKTRHNVGFMVIDNYLKMNNISVSKEKFNGIYYETIKNNEKVLFLKPQKYMNLSGEVVLQYMNYFKIDYNDILVISDDLDMPCGKIKLKSMGSCGGHNGLRNIEDHIGTKQYKRIKIGIANNKNIETKDYVLGKFNSEENEILQKSIDTVSSAIDDYFVYDFEKLMSKYN